MSDRSFRFDSGQKNYNYFLTLSLRPKMGCWNVPIRIRLSQSSKEKDGPQGNYMMCGGRPR